jgi:hypothetical protein
MTETKMKTPLALIVGALIISGTLVWHAEKAEEAARCGGFLSSQLGGNALETLAAVKVSLANGQDIRDNNGISILRNMMEAAGCHPKAL